MKNEQKVEIEKSLTMIWGAAGIAREIDRPVRATFHMLEKGQIPAKKIGGRWCTNREQLRRALIGEVG